MRISSVWYRCEQMSFISWQREPHHLKNSFITLLICFAWFKFASSKGIDVTLSAILLYMFFFLAEACQRTNAAIMKLIFESIILNSHSNI